MRYSFVSDEEPTERPLETPMQKLPMKPKRNLKLLNFNIGQNKGQNL
jgi:hypothetical protein